MLSAQGLLDLSIDSIAKDTGLETDHVRQR